MSFEEPAERVIITDVDEWLEENEQFFLPPVCNKMMESSPVKMKEIRADKIWAKVRNIYWRTGEFVEFGVDWPNMTRHQRGQMKAFFVGGPNQRLDYHIEEGEELFYMLRGDMCLKVLEQGKHKDIPIKEGEIFLLRGSMPHSPQRQKDTIGMVLERERDPSEKDGLRYYVPGTTETLYEEWFHCTDLGTQLAPVIKRFFASEQHKTGKPIPGTITDDPPVTLDQKSTLETPFSLQSWIDDNREEIKKKGKKALYGDEYQFSVVMWGPGEEEDGGCEAAEVWMWQFEGTSTVAVGDSKKTKYEINKNQCLLVPKGEKYTATRSDDALCLVCYQDPRKKKPVKKD